MLKPAPAHCPYCATAPALDEQVIDDEADEVVVVARVVMLELELGGPVPYADWYAAIEAFGTHCERYCDSHWQ